MDVFVTSMATVEEECRCSVQMHLKLLSIHHRSRLLHMLKSREVVLHDRGREGSYPGSSGAAMDYVRAMILISGVSSLDAN